MPCGQRIHIPGAHEQRVVGAQILEHAPCRADRGGRQRHGVGADASFGAHPFGGRERGLKQFIEDGAGAAALLRDPVGVFQLPEDLHLAQHHGIKAGGHAEERAR